MWHSGNNENLVGTRELQLRVASDIECEDTTCHSGITPCLRRSSSEWHLIFTKVKITSATAHILPSYMHASGTDLYIDVISLTRATHQNYRSCFHDWPCAPYVFLCISCVITHMCATEWQKLYNGKASIWCYWYDLRHARHSM